MENILLKQGRLLITAMNLYTERWQTGKKFSQHKLTAAHKTLPLGTKVKVINLTNHKTVKVRITDRGPFIKGRIIDLSRKAAKRINMVDAGVAAVELKYKKKK